MKKYSVLVYLTKGYEGKRNNIDHLYLLQNFFTDQSMFWIILATARNRYRIIEVTIFPVCRWCIFRLSLSFTDFISFISEWLTSVPKFHKFFFMESFSKLLYEIRLCFNIIPSNYRPKNDMVISPIKEVIK